MNRNKTITYDPYVNYHVTNTRYHVYKIPSKPKYLYTVEQDGQTYRCCEWCQRCCTREIPCCDFCDRVISCPLLFFILLGLLLVLLFAALLILFGLHPSINPARRYYGIISKLSIFNRTKYIYNLDGLCKTTGFINHCLDLVTSTAVSVVSTTITLNRASSTTDYSYRLLVLCISFYFTHLRICFRNF